MPPQPTEKDREKAEELMSHWEPDSSEHAIMENIAQALAAERQAVGEAIINTLRDSNYFESENELAGGYEEAVFMILAKCKELGIEIKE